MWKLSAALILAFALTAWGDNDSGPTATTTTTPTITTSNDLGACTVGMKVRPGQSCTYSDGTFSVRKSDGFGCVNDSICSGSKITINTFSASKIKGANDWRIDAL